MLDTPHPLGWLHIDYIVTELVATASILRYGWKIKMTAASAAVSASNADSDSRTGTS